MTFVMPSRCKDFLEKMARTGARYTEVILSHFGVSQVIQDYNVPNILAVVVHRLLLVMYTDFC